MKRKPRDLSVSEVIISRILAHRVVHGVANPVPIARLRVTSTGVNIQLQAFVGKAKMEI